jgi:uncharacterized protein
LHTAATVDAAARRARAPLRTRRIRAQTHPPQRGAVAYEHAGVASGMAGTPLDDERYINLETFKKDGTGVKTPVWAAPLDGRLVVFTDGTSYKVKRLRNDPRCRIAPCDVRGNVRGAWHEATGRILDDDGHKQRAHTALRAKYGWQVRVLDFFSRLGGRIGRRAYLELDIK